MTTIRLSMTSGERKALLKTCALMAHMLQAPEFEQEREELSRQSGISNTHILNSVTTACEFVASGATESSKAAIHGLIWVCAAALLSAKQDGAALFAEHGIRLPLLRNFNERLHKTVRRAA